MSEKRNSISEDVLKTDETAKLAAAAEKTAGRFYAEQADLSQLKQRFTAFLMKHGFRKAAANESAFSVRNSAARMRTAEEIWELLNRRYTEKRRYYHSWGHIAFMLQLMDKHRSTVSADHLPRYPVPLEAAVWFHDAVQFSGSEDERRSADLAVQQLRRCGMQIDYVLRTAELIRSTELPSASAGSGTKKTAYDPKEESGGMIESSGMIESGGMIESSGSVGTATGAACGQKPDPDADLLHDLDYAVLGTSEKLFLSYEQTIRLEYAHLSDEAYAAGRSSFLRTLLQKDVFRTEYFKVRYEEQALHNISMQLERFGKYSGGG